MTSDEKAMEAARVEMSKGLYQMPGESRPYENAVKRIINAYLSALSPKPADPELGPVAELVERAKGIGFSSNPNDYDKLVADLVAALSSLQAQVEGLRRERDEARDTLRYCERQWSDERGTMIDKIQAERAAREAAEAREALADIAKQRLSSELSGEDHERASFEDGYDSCVRRARSVLSGETK